MPFSEGSRTSDARFETLKTRKGDDIDTGETGFDDVTSDPVSVEYHSLKARTRSRPVAQREERGVRRCDEFRAPPDDGRGRPAAQERHRPLSGSALGQQLWLETVVSSVALAAPGRCVSAANLEGAVVHVSDG
ncbi:hypothetical protein AWC17_02860 [Mycobacterium nebraskense]|uniref:Uncharacterized protein n=1 Tax=Mycobacterium nebraskense TaxID=244292 RepID=A0A1X1ZNY9_9MYCO|nr:hypothetical protein WU83_09920 [Mycobacterium nebraskense]ORW25063.1 hypothetical protein AWC17_02860 [Mycobacterium nebraskense]